MSSETPQPTPLRFQATDRTDTGLLRKNNEDALIFAPDRGLFGVCDGMGGHAAGEVASEVASKALLEEISVSCTDPHECLRLGLEKANQQIFRIQAERPECRGMGTTVSALWIGPSNGTWIAHVGDSRVYRLADGRLEQLTDDHSPVFRLYQHGLLAKDDLRQHPHKNLLDRSLGVLPTVEADLFPVEVHSGDIFLICTDGLSDELTDREIAEVLSHDSIEEAADRLIAQAKATGGRDNISLVVVKVT